MDNNIIEKMRREIVSRSDLFEEQTKGTKDEYNLYREHVQYVYKYAVMLAKDADVDKEVVELSALLHDISMTDATLDRSRHNEFGSAMAEQLLREQNYPEEKTQLVAKCILNHSSKRASYRTTLEEELLVCADGLAHFDAYKSFYSLAHKVMGLNDEDSLKFIQDKLTKDYVEIRENLKHLVSDTYAHVMNAKTIQEILDTTEFDSKQETRTLLSVGTIFLDNDLQSVEGRKKMKYQYKEMPESMSGTYGEFAKNFGFDWKEFIMGIPTPMFLVTTYKSNGQPNATMQSWAGFTSANHGGGYYVILCSVNKRGHLYQSLNEKKVAVLNFMSSDLYEACMKTIQNNQFEADEITSSGLTAEKASWVEAPMVAECFMNLECRYLWEKEIVPGDDHVMICLEVVGGHIEKDYMEDMFGDKGVLYNVHYPINPEDVKEKGCDYVAALRKVNQSYEY